MDKLKVHNVALSFLQDKINAINIELDDLKRSLSSSTKSSVGDKHETSRAMIQIEQERLSNQLGQQKQQLDLIKSIDPEKEYEQIESGSLVQLNSGWFYLSIGIGQISIGNENVFCLSPATPMGQQLLGKQKGDKVFLNKEFEILEVL
jgi:transcription elongation GreA/GreB family factor